ncbi:MAG: DUF4350 domain-containing protein [Candidatus Pseudobacter hemicellulosilyticus]|uniref:DUF4350 domain-containing protein n=1 Tax=Candidatus Pseudobacter hemicellulosilyticus TaxID=3121375 RepID=A0AAJ6BEY9_9BACT|nr:MAG: DUF4350 domain-containing protein [Pseudobacter sp.]
MTPFKKLFLLTILAGACQLTVRSQTTTKGKTVLLDYYYNNETKKGKDGKSFRYHYTWEDTTWSGYSGWGNMFRQLGASTQSLETAPTTANLQNASVYIIVDPDTEKETPKPNFIQPQDIKAITSWVKKGGVLVLLANDSGNCEFTHLNMLAKKFGVRFKEDRYNLVFNDQFEQGALKVPADHAILKTAKKVFIKELSTLELKKPAMAVFQDKGNIIMSVTPFGKGTVLCIGDPWIYNEYIGGKKLPDDFENPKAAADLARWLLEKAR